MWDFASQGLRESSPVLGAVARRSSWRYRVAVRLDFPIPSHTWFGGKGSLAVYPRYSVLLGTLRSGKVWGAGKTEFFYIFVYDVARRACFAMWIVR